MHRKHWIVVPALLAAGMVGCGKSGGAANGPAPSAGGAAEQVATSTDPTTVAKLDAPGASVFQFLEAIRTGNDATATQLLTTVARQKAAATNRSVGPAASDTALFQVGKVQYVAQDGARVVCTWTDLDEDGKPQTEEAVWVLRREAEGWRIAGVAATVFEGEPPLLLNFEDPEEMAQKQKWVREEIARRAQQADWQAQNQENPEKPLRR